MPAPADREPVDTARWSVVLTLKPLADAKSRLAESPWPRHALALALALDTAEAALSSTGTGLLVAVTDDPEAAAGMRDLGAVVVGDDPADGLNPALQHGADHAQRLRPSEPVAVLQADLGALRPRDLATALRVAAAHPRAFVADAEGTGTTLLTSRAADRLDPRFGAGSRQAHLRSGAFEIAGDGIASLRRDIDLPEHVAQAAALGLGARTAALVRPPLRASGD